MITEDHETFLEKAEAPQHSLLETVETLESSSRRLRINQDAIFNQMWTTATAKEGEEAAIDARYGYV